jgi:tRNA(Ile)-lysidine synthase
MARRDPFEQQIAAAWPPDQWRDCLVVVAVSGGCDSVGLARALAGIRSPGSGSLALAHFNHRWRGDESDADESFVRAFANQLGWPCHVGWGDPTQTSPGRGREAMARRQRYEFLRTICNQAGARYVALAHTAQDQVETILHRIVRGTGIAGLAGIPACRPLSQLTTLVRPLLHIERHQIEKYLRELGQAYRTDSTNQDRGYTRNRIRLELLPLLRASYNSQVDHALLRLSDLAQQTQQVVDRFVEARWDGAVAVRGDGAVRINCCELGESPEHLVRELLVRVWRSQNWPMQNMSHEKWTALARLMLGSPSARQVLVMPGAIRAEREARSEFLVLTPRE